MSEQPKTPKPRHGCFFYGCIAGIVCLVAVLVAFLLGMQMFKKFLNEFTDAQPSKLPKLELSQSDIEEVQRRVDLFQDAVSTGRPTRPLELTGDDINAILAARSDLQSLTNKIYVKVEGDQLSALVSVPMDQLGFQVFKGRYLNGEVRASVFLENGLLRVVPSAVTVKGKPLPDVYLQKLQKENLARKINENSKASIALNRMEKITVRDGKVVFVPKVEK